MIAICQRELRRLFRGLWGWIYIAGLLIVSGIAASYYNFYGGSANILYPLVFAEYATLPLLPCLCAAVGVHDRRDGTDRMLRALPIRTGQVVMGQYTALLCVIAIPVGCLCLLPPLFSLYGEADMAASYVALAGFFLLCAALAAICLFLSSLTSRMPLACIAGVVVLLLLFFLPLFGLLVPTAGWVSFLLLLLLGLIIAAAGWLFTRSRVVGILLAAVLTVGTTLAFLLAPAYFSGLLYDILSVFSLFTGYEQAAQYGLLDLNILLLLLSVTVLFLFMTWAVRERRRLPGGGDAS